MLLREADFYFRHVMPFLYFFPFCRTEIILMSQKRNLSDWNLLSLLAGWVHLNSGALETHILWRGQAKWLQLQVMLDGK